MIFKIWNSEFNLWFYLKLYIEFTISGWMLQSWLMRWTHDFKFTVVLLAWNQELNLHLQMLEVWVQLSFLKVSPFLDKLHKHHIFDILSLFVKKIKKNTNFGQITHHCLLLTQFFFNCHVIGEDGVNSICISNRGIYASLSCGNS